LSAERVEANVSGCDSAVLDLVKMSHSNLNDTELEVIDKVFGDVLSGAG
jgi:hypothetical protein